MAKSNAFRCAQCPFLCFWNIKLQLHATRFFLISHLSSLTSHLSPLISHHSLLTSHSRQPDAKSTSFTLLAFYLNRTAIKLDELMNQDKSQPGS